MLTVLITPTRVTLETTYIINRSLDVLSNKYENIVLLEDFNACVDDEFLETFCKFYSLHSLIKQPKCLKILTNKPSSFQNKCVIETGLSDFHRMTFTFANFLLKPLITGILKKIDNERFIDSLHYTLSEEQIDYSKNSDKFFEISQNVLHKHAPTKKSIFVGAINVS